MHTSGYDRRKSTYCLTIVRAVWPANPRLASHLNSDTVLPLPLGTGSPAEQEREGTQGAEPNAPGSNTGQAAAAPLSPPLPNAGLLRQGRPEDLPHQSCQA